MFEGEAKNHDLASAVSAGHLTDSIAKSLNVTLKDTHVSLSRLRSRDSADLPASCLDAVDAFGGNFSRMPDNRW